MISTGWEGSQLPEAAIHAKQTHLNTDFILHLPKIGLHLAVFLYWTLIYTKYAQIRTISILNRYGLKHMTGILSSRKNTAHQLNSSKGKKIILKGMQRPLK